MLRSDSSLFIWVSFFETVCDVICYFLSILYWAMELDEALEEYNWFEFETEITSPRWQTEVSNALKGLGGMYECYSVIDAAFPQEGHECKKK